MDMAKSLYNEHSKKNTLVLVNYIGKNKNRYSEMWSFLSSEDPILIQRSSWVVYTHFEHFPLMFLSYRNKAIKHLGNDRHQAVQRALLKPLFLSPLVKDPGELVDKCFNLLNDPRITVAPKMWSMKIIDKVAQKETDLYPELKLSIEKILPNATSGLKNAAHKILKKI